MKQVVLKLEVNDEKARKKVMKTVSTHSGVESVSIDMKDKKLTVVGDVDAAQLVNKLRKLCHTDIITVGPVKNPEPKKEEPKKEEPKKQEEEKKRRKNMIPWLSW